MGKQLLVSIASFLGSLAVWTFMLGGNLMPALVLMVVLLIHEMGHYLAARFIGARAELPVFIVIGAFVKFENTGRTLRDSFIVSAAGPVLGSAAALLMYFFGGHSAVLMSAAALGLALNLFQLIPVPPFDGGHMTLAIDRRLWKVGAIFVLAFAAASLFHGNFMPAMLVWMMWDGTKNYMQATEMQAAANPERFAVPAGEKLIYSLVYFGLTFGLIFACWAFGVRVL